MEAYQGLSTFRTCESHVSGLWWVLTVAMVHQGLTRSLWCHKKKDMGGLLLSDRDHGSFFSLSLTSLMEGTSVCTSVTILLLLGLFFVCLFSTFSHWSFLVLGRRCWPVFTCSQEQTCPLKTSRWPARHPPTSPRGSGCTRTPALPRLLWYVSVCLICLSICRACLASTWPCGTRVKLPSCFSKAFRAQTIKRNSAKMFHGFQLSFNWLLQSCCGQHLRCSSVRECHEGYADEVTCVTLFSSQLVPWSGRAGDRRPNDACLLAAITSSWTVRHYKAVRMTSEQYADNVLLSFVSLHYGPFVSLPPFFCLLALSLHALFTCLLSTTVSFQSNFWPLSPQPQLSWETGRNQMGPSQGATSFYVEPVNTSLVYAKLHFLNQQM